MKLRNLRDFVVSSVAGASMLAAVGCTELNNNTYVGFPDKGSRADVEVVADAGADALVNDTVAPDTQAVDLATPDTSVADMTLPDNKIATPDQKVADLTKPDYAIPDAALKKDGAVVILKDGLTGDMTQPDAGKGCTNLSQLLKCMGNNYQTLVAPGWNVYMANKNGYKNIITDETKFKQGVASGNPCSAPKTFTKQTCLDYLKKATPGSSVIKLEGLNKVMIEGYSPNDQAIALELLSAGKLSGKTCVVTGTIAYSAKIICP